MDRMGFKELKYLIENNSQKYNKYMENLPREDFYKIIIEGLEEVEKSLSVIDFLRETFDKIRVEELYLEKGEKLENHLN